MTSRSQAFYDPPNYAEARSLRWKIYALLWGCAANLFLPLVPTRCRWLRNGLLRAFGATIDRSVIIYATCRIYSPSNLVMGPRTCLGPRVDCYNPGPIRIGADVTVSQDAFLCTASHDIDTPGRPLVTRPITIGDGAWIFARAIVLPGVSIGTGAVVAAGAVVTRDVAAFGVAAGNPAAIVRQRRYRGNGESG
jgi:putative colanic acid biosynthesis acetyltransferase WcaF